MNHHEKREQLLQVEDNAQLCWRPRLDLQFMAQLERLAPFGQGNLAPTFALLGQEVQSVRTMGRDSDHLRLSLARCPDAIGWGMGERAETLLPGDQVDIAFRLERNRYKGREQLQLLLQDLKPSE